VAAVCDFALNRFISPWAILVFIDAFSLVAVLAIVLAIGALVGWLAGRPGLARLAGELERERASVAERERVHAQTDARLRETFQALSAEALKTNNRAFLDLAETRLREARSEASADLEARKLAVENLLTPLAKTLDRVDHEIRESERRRVESATTLVERITALDAAGQELRRETVRLVDALKRPGVRGRWGELQLKRVIELAGMLQHCDFDAQPTVTSSDAERRMRPDVIVRLAGGKHLVIDAKAPLDAYLKALDAPDESSRQAWLADHARQVRTHLLQLAAKGYAAHVHPSPDFVVMFLPGEMFFSAALEQDASLIEFGVEQRVIPASPTTLIALLRAVAYGWQQEAMEENARKIGEVGRNLYESVRVLGGHFDSLGSKLKSALDAYNLAVGSLERNVLVKARKLKDLHAANGGEDIRTLESIDQVPRMLQAAELTGGLPFQETELREPDERAEARDLKSEVEV
jgi:DNA recombination protein RmuC